MQECKHTSSQKFQKKEEGILMDLAYDEELASALQLLDSLRDAC